MGKRYIDPTPQMGDTAGESIAGARMFFFEAGTSTPLDTFSDEPLTVPNSNPVVCDADGRVPDVFLSPVNYKVVLKEADEDVTIWERDPVNGAVDAEDTIYSPPYLNATDRSVEDWLGDIPSLADFDVDKTGSTSAIPAFNRAYASGESNIYIPPGTYLGDTGADGSIVPVGGVNMFSPVGGKIQTAAFINHQGTEHLFDTDQTATNFNGMSLANIRIIGGVTGKWAVRSHYPYSYLRNVHVENTSGNYAGNGLLLHNDGAVASMGGWGSRLSDCKIVTKNDATNKRTGIELAINGGNVLVEKCETIFGEIGIFVNKGENISLVGCNTNQIQDHTSTSGNIQRAAILVGGTGSDLAVKACSITDCYIESHSRAVLIRDAVGTKITGAFIDDTESFDPSFAAADGAIYHSAKASNTSVNDCYIKTGYNNHYPLYSEAVGTNLVGMSSENNYLYLDRGALTLIANNQPTNDISRFVSMAGTHFKSTISSVDFHEDFLYYTAEFNNEFGRLDKNPATTAVAFDLFTIKAGERWEVMSNQADDDTRFTQAVVHKPLTSGAAGIDTIVTGTLNAISLSGDDVQVTQTTGSNKRIISTWRRQA